MNYDLYQRFGPRAFSQKLPSMVVECVDGKCSKGKMYFVANICLDLENYAEAVKIYQKINEIFGLSDVGYNLLGYSFDHLGRLEEAINAYQKSLLINPKNQSSLRNLAQIEYLSEGKMGIKWTEALFREYPDSEEAPRWYSTALWNSNHREQAVSVIESALKKFTNDTEIRELAKNYQEILRQE